MKKGVRQIVLAFVLIAVFVSLIFGGVLFYSIFKAATSVKMIAPDLYTMEFLGDYGFDAFLAQGGASNPDELAFFISRFLSRGFYTSDAVSVNPAPRDYGCSFIYSSANTSAKFSGRNYDWDTKGETMIVHTVPQNGYESISTCCLNFLGFGDDWKPTGFGNALMSIAAIYVPLDGMNEKGLVIADLMAGDKVETHQKTPKPDLTTTTALRLMLDKASTVDEALALLQQYDMHSDIGSAHHYAISDANGRSVVVEYVDDTMLVTETDVVTNHYIGDSPKKGIGSENSHARFNKLSVIDKNLDYDGVKRAIRSVAQQKNAQSDSDTVWSLVYAQSGETPWADFYYKQNFDTPIRLTLKQKRGKFYE